MAAIPKLFGSDWTPATSGFSGASVYLSATHVLKAWPHNTRRERVIASHKAWLTLAHLPFVPRLERDAAGNTFAEIDSRFWERNARKPGEVAGTINDDQIQSAAIAIAQMHRVWVTTANDVDVVSPRIAFVNAALARLPIKIDPLPMLSLPGSQCVHGDLHREHILFTGDDVTGVIDFASVKHDHPAIDLARYFDGVNISTAMAAYHAAGGSSQVTVEIVEQLTRVIAAGTVAHWLPLGEKAPRERLQRAFARLRR